CTKRIPSRTTRIRGTTRTFSTVNCTVCSRRFISAPSIVWPRVRPLESPKAASKTAAPDQQGREERAVTDAATRFSEVLQEELDLIAIRRAQSRPEPKAKPLRGGGAPVPPRPA